MIGRNMARAASVTFGIAAFFTIVGFAPLVGSGTLSMRSWAILAGTYLTVAVFFRNDDEDEDG